MNSKLKHSFQISNFKFQIILPVLIVFAAGFVLWSNFNKPVSADWYNTLWQYRQKITIDKTKVGGGAENETNFPVLVSITEPKLIKNAQSSGNDIMFTDSDGITKLSHEIESYTATTGALIAWVKVPTLTYQTNNVLYMYYGSASAPSQQNATDVWSNGFAGVWHLKETGTGAIGDYKDSTSNTNNSIESTNQPTATTAKINGGENFNGTSQSLAVGTSNGSLNITGNNITVSTWFNPGTLSSPAKGWMVSKMGDSAGSWGLYFGTDSTNAPQYKKLCFGANLGPGWADVGCGDNNTTISVGSWAYATVTYNGSNVIYYINGGYDKSIPKTGNFVSVNHTARFGYEDGWSSQRLNGSLDEVRVSTSVRSAGWISTEYNNQNSPSTFLTLSSTQEKTKAPVLNWKFDEGLGTTVNSPAGTINWYNSSWSYRKKLTIDHTKVGGTTENEANFPVLVSLTGLSNINTNGTDIRFTSSDGVTELPREIESYSGGTLVAWVKATLSYQTDTVLYMYYGNSSATEPSASSTYGSQNVWDSNFKGVWHLADPTNPTDSTSNANNGTNHGTTATTGKVSGGSKFDANSNQWIDAGNGSSLSTTTSLNYSFWIKQDSLNTTDATVIMKGTSWENSNYMLRIYNGSLRFFIGHSNNLFRIWSTDEQSISPGQWSFCTFNYTSGDTTPTVTINGVSKTLTLYNAGGALSLESNSSNLWIGHEYFYFNGYLDELNISTARSAGWIATEYNNQSSPGTFMTAGSVEQNNFWQTGDMCVSGKCILFANTSISPSANIQNVQSVAFWIKPTTTTQSILDLDGGTHTITISSGTVSANGFSSPTIYINGKTGGTVTTGWNYVEITTGTTFTATTSMTLGKVSSTYFSGYIDEFKIYDYARTAAEVKSDYNSGSVSVKSAAVSVGSAPIGYWNFENNLNDVSSSQSAGTWNGTGNRYTQGKYGKGAQFNGINDFISVTSTASGVRTASFWIKPTTNTASMLNLTSTDYITASSGSIGGAWAYRKKLTISKTNVSADLSYFPLLVKFTSDSDLSKALSTGYDLRFTQSDGTTILPYERESWTGGGGSAVTANIWVRVPTISTSANTDIYVYYGNSTANTDWTAATSTITNCTSITNAQCTWKENATQNFGAVWHLRETGTGSVGDYKDSTSNSNNSVNTTGQPSTTTGQIDGAQTFGGGPYYVSASHSSSIDLSTLTYSTWFYTTSWQSDFTIIASKWGYWGSNPNNEWHFSARPNGANRYLNLYLSSGSNLYSTTVLSLSQWNYVGFSISGETVTFYVNGLTAGTVSGSVTAGASKIAIGDINSRSVSKIDETRISSTVRSADWIKFEYYNQSSANNEITAGTQESLMYVNGQPSTTLTANQWQFVTVIFPSAVTANAITFGKANSAYTTGVIDEVRFYNYAQTQKQIIADMNAGQQTVGSPVGHAVSYWKFDGTTTDSGPGRNDATASNTSWNSNGKFGKALQFNGTSSVVTVANTISSQTISMWVNPTTTTQPLITLASGVSVSASSGTITATGFTSPTIYVNGNPSTTLRAGVWNHVVVVDTAQTTANAITIGKATTYFSGLIDEVKIYNYALTSDEVKQDYNRGATMQLGNFGVASQSASALYCVPGDTSTCNPPVAEWNFDEGQGASVADTSGNGNTGTWNGTGKHWDVGKVGRGGKFNGSDDYVQKTSPSFATAAQGTITGWFKTPSATSISKAIIGLTSLATSGDFKNFSIVVGSTNTAYHDHFLGFTVKTAGLTVPLEAYVNNYVVDDNNWHYFALTVGPAGNNIYIDGVQRVLTYINGSSASTDFFSAITSADTFDIGATTYLGGLYPSYFNGSIDQVRIYNYARTAAQVAWDYNNGKPVAYWKMDECTGTTIKDLTGNGNTGTLTNATAGDCNTNANTAWYNGRTGKFGASLSFDGVDDYINLGNSANSLELLDNFSISAWVKLPSNASGNSNAIWDKDTNGVAILQSGSGANIIYLSKSGVAADSHSNVALPLNQWVFITVTKTGSSRKIYFNSVDVTVSDSQQTFANTATAPRIGARGPTTGTSQYTTGQIDDVQIFNYALTAAQVKNIYNQNSAVRFGQ